jgi:hypothetical protein
MDKQIGPVWIGGCIVLALVVATGAAELLKVVATPSDYDARLAAVEQQVSRAERLASTPGDGAAYPKGAVCEGLSGPGFGKARGSLEDAATAEGLQGLQVAWGQPVDGGARIGSLPFTLRIEGPYEKVVTFMDRVSRGAPAVFVDSADLTGSGLGAQLSLSGRVFCWTRG